MRSLVKLSAAWVVLLATSAIAFADSCGEHRMEVTDVTVVEREYVDVTFRNNKDAVATEFEISMTIKNDQNDVYFINTREFIADAPVAPGDTHRHRIASENIQPEDSWVVVAVERIGVAATRYEDGRAAGFGGSLKAFLPECEDT